MSSEIKYLDFTRKSNQRPKEKVAKIIDFASEVQKSEEKEQTLFEAIVFELQRAAYSLYNPELLEKIEPSKNNNLVQLDKPEIRETKKDPDIYEFVKNYTILLLRHNVDNNKAYSTIQITIEDVLREFYARDRVLKAETS